MSLLPASAPTLLAINTWNSWASMAIGFGLNFLLCYLAKRYSTTAELKEYRRIVFYFCAQNVSCLLLHAINQPSLFTGYDGRSFLFAQGIVIWFTSMDIRVYVFIMYMAMLQLLLATLSAQFLDRYLLLCRSYTNMYRRYAILLSIQLYFVIIIAMLMVVSWPTNDYSIEDILLSANDNGSDRNQQLGNWHPSETKWELKIVAEGDMQKSLSRIMIMILGASLALSYALIVFCYLRIGAFLTKNMTTTTVMTTTNAFNNSTANRDSIHQIMLNMLFQALLPMYVIVIILVIFVNMLTSEYSPSIVAIQMLAFVPINWLPLFNPIVTILTIRSYRFGLLTMFGMKHAKGLSTGGGAGGNPLLLKTSSYQPAAPSTASPSLTPIGTVHSFSNQILEH